MALQCCSRGDYCALPAGCLYAIKPSHPRYRFALSEAVLPGVSYTPVPNQSMAARSHEGRSGFCTMTSCPFASLRSAAALDVDLPPGEQHLRFASAVPCSAPFWVALALPPLASMRTEPLRRFWFFRAASNSHSHKLPLRAGSDTLRSPPAYWGERERPPPCGGFGGKPCANPLA
jgi:hypothetical protein